MNAQARYVGIDIGGTTIKWMLVSASGQPVASGHEPTDATRMVRQLTTLGERLADEYTQLAGIGVVCPGVLDEGTGQVRYASNVALAGLRPAELLAGSSGVPARLGHDGRAAGLAEGLFGAGKGAVSYAMIPIGTGVSAALYLQGRMWAGATLCAGEIGHTPVFPGGEQCACGQRGCLEVYASAQGIARRYAQASDKVGRAPGANGIGAKEVEKRLGADPVADQVWATAVDALALALVHLTLGFDPERFIIGGGLSHAGPVLVEPLKARLEQYLAWRKAPQIVLACLGEKAGLWGALALASMAAGSTDHESWCVNG
ncbi:ROK family protein [Schaalia suimastitidis]|uniref:ROK family protein n=1 Tax=Schaalia suimastitidis TaxID=121163 RepID=UPI0004113317|nr:ROK family protein [Schaalia suimastitidis]